MENYAGTDFLTLSSKNNTADKIKKKSGVVVGK